MMEKNLGEIGRILDIEIEKYFKEFERRNKIDSDLMIIFRNKVALALASNDRAIALTIVDTAGHIDMIPWPSKGNAEKLALVFDEAPIIKVLETTIEPMFYKKFKSLGEKVKE